MSNVKIKIKILTPERTVLEEEVDQISIPTGMGYITVLPGHLPLVGLLAPGEVLARKGQDEILLAVSSGLIEVKKNEVVLLADTAELATEIDEERAETARQRAVELLQRVRSQEVVDHTALMIKLNKELARLKVVRKHRSRLPFNNS